VIYSFDVFDTLLGRLRSRPFDRYRMVFQQAKLGPADLERMTRLRLKGEEEARNRIGPDGYSLKDIYRDMELILGLGDTALGEAYKNELAMEQMECFAISEGQRLLKEASKNHRVIYVSDMYLPPEFIRNLLEKNDLWIPGSQLFVSHTEGCAKHSGLFKKICRELGVAPNEIIHYGDNWASDVVAPRKTGIKAVHFTEVVPTRYEKRFSGVGEWNMSDAVRAVRLQCPWTAPNHKKAIYETAASVAAPLFIAYVIWLKKQAQGKGLKRLYFISRDGLIFKKIYDLIFQGEIDAPTSHYLYGSRQAWSCARLLRLEEKDIETLTYANPSLSLRQFCGRCGVAVEKMYLEAFKGLFENPDQPLNKKEIAAIRNSIRKGPWREKIIAEGRAKADFVRKYFHQNGMSQSSYGLVDLGWFGNLQTYVETLLPDCPPNYGFYLNLRSNPEIVRQGRAAAFVSSLQLEPTDLNTAVSLLEVLAAAPERSVYGYQKEGSKIVPITEKGGDYFESLEEVEIQHKAILAVAGKYKAMQLDHAQGGDALRDQALCNFRSFLQKPSPVEAEVYGSICFVSRQEGGKGAELAPRLGFIGALEILKLGFYIKEASWPQGMIQRSGGLSRILLKGRLKLTKLRRCLGC